MPRRKSGFDIDDLLDAPFEAMDRGFEALDDVFDTLGDTFDGLTGDLERDRSKLAEDLEKVKGDLERAKKRSKSRSSVQITTGSKRSRKPNKLTFDYKGEKVTVHYANANDVQIVTSGDVDAELMAEVKRRIKEKKQSSRQRRVRDWPKPRTRSQHEAVYQTQPAVLFWTRNWKGEKKEPLKFTPESKVAVSGKSMLGRKYTVEVDGTTIYMLKFEELMERCHHRGDLDAYVRSWSDDEKAIMRKILASLDALKISEDHHRAAAKLLSP